MQKLNNFEKRAKYFLAGISIVFIFDLALTLSIFTRMIIYLFNSEYIAPVIQLIPLIFFATMTFFEFKLLIGIIWKYKKEKKNDNFSIMNIFYEILKKNQKIFKIELIFIYAGCSMIVCLAGLGIIPMVLLIKGKNGLNHYNQIQEN